MELLCSDVQPFHLDYLACAVDAVEEVISNYRIPRIEPGDISGSGCQLGAVYSLSFIYTLNKLICHVVTLLHTFVPDQVIAIVRGQLTMVVHRLITDVNTAYPCQVRQNTLPIEDHLRCDFQADSIPIAVELKLRSICDFHFQRFLEGCLVVTDSVHFSMSYCIHHTQRVSGERVHIPSNRYTPVSALGTPSAQDATDFAREDWFLA